MEDAVRNEDSLFNPTMLNEAQNPEVELDNIPRWIHFPNEEPFFTNGKLVNLSSDIPKSNAMGE